MRAAPIVCPEESPKCARRRKPLPTVEIDAPTPARGEGLVIFMGCSVTSGGEPKGTGGERKAPSAPSGAIPCPRLGLTRRLRRGLGLAVPRGAHTFLSVAKEKCAKESQRHGDSGKKPFMPILAAGLAMSRAS